MSKYSINACIDLVSRCLQRAGASEAMAASTARALVAAEAQGLASHGLARVSQYVGHLRCNRVNGAAVPVISNGRGGACLIDAGEGLAFPACELAVAEAVRRAAEFGVAFVAVARSHHFGVAALHLQPAADAGMVGVALGNTPAAMPAWGGKRPLFGVNPIAAVFPRRRGRALVIDLALSQTARGELMLAAREGRPIPPDWALDKDGQPTTDAQAGLDGLMLPAGGVKGAMLAMMVELLCCALGGAAFGFEADSFLGVEGNRPRIGHAFLVIDPAALAGADAYAERVETLVDAMLADPQVRLPGERRCDNAARAAREGIELSPTLLVELKKMAAA